MVSINTKMETKPWGFHTTLKQGSFYKIKYLIINPGHGISEQYHNYRSEIWTVLEGIGKVKLNGLETMIKEDDVIDIQEKDIHQLTNIGSKQLIVHEVQYGLYCGENDIIRINDPYNRL